MHPQRRLLQCLFFRFHISFLVVLFFSNQSYLTECSQPFTHVSCVLLGAPILSIFVVVADVRSIATVSFKIVSFFQFILLFPPLFLFQSILPIHLISVNASRNRPFNHCRRMASMLVRSLEITPLTRGDFVC